MTTNLLSVIEQQQKALEHCVDAIVERGLNGSQEQARKWGLQLPLERAYAALAAGQQALEQTQGEVERSLYEMLQMCVDENKQLRAQLAGMERLLHFKAAIEADPPASEPAQSSNPPAKHSESRLLDSEQAPKGCSYCTSPLYAGTKCKYCGRVSDPAPSTDICRNCAGQGWEPSVNDGKVPCSFCQPAPSTAGELTLEQITRIYDRYGGDMVNCTRAIERELAAARSQPVREPL